MNSIGFGNQGSNTQKDLDLLKYSKKLGDKLNNKKLPNAGIQSDFTKPASAIKELCAILDSEIIGQDMAKQIIFRILERLNSGYVKSLDRNGDRTKPIAKLFFAGPSGVGKTQMAKTLQKILNKMFGNKLKLIKINCADFTDPQGHGLNQLKGASMGYIGCDQKPKLHPDNINGKGRVILFDEIEKGGQPLWDILLAILDDGIQDINYLKKKNIFEEKVSSNPTSNNGDIVDTNGEIINNPKETEEEGVVKACFKDAIIIMTSNLGTREIQNLLKGGIGFNSKSADYSYINEEMEKIVNKDLSESSRPEFENRLDNIVPFNFLTIYEYRKILDMFINIMTDNLLKHNSIATNCVLFEITEDARDFIVVDVYSKYRYKGVRALPTYLNDTVIHMIAHEINENTFSNGDNKVLLIDAFENKKTGDTELLSFIMDIQDCDSDKIIKIEKKKDK